MTEVEDLIAFFEDFRKHPILPSQNNQILCAIIDGTISTTAAKKILASVMERNLEVYNKFMNMSEAEVHELIKKYEEKEGVTNEQTL